MKIHRRKIEFVDPEVQGALARRLALHWVLFLSIAAVLVVGLKWMSNPFTPISEHLVDAWWTYAPVLLVFICLTPVFVFDSVRISNRFTGPVLRLRKAIREMADGETPRKIDLRDGDFWKDVASDFNRVIERVDGKADPSV
ncbi:MAG: HAMP domain-containing protein [Lacipirellulaceae bacterium]